MGKTRRHLRRPEGRRAGTAPLTPRVPARSSATRRACPPDALSERITCTSSSTTSPESALAPVSESGACASDRDRGTPRDVAPPTPPGIRVRTTAVRPVEPSHVLEIGQSERVEVSTGKRPAQRRRQGDPPRSAVAASREDGILGVDTSLPQLSKRVPGRAHCFQSTARSRRRIHLSRRIENLTNARKGRPKGAPSKATAEAKEVCRAFVQDPAYLRRFKARLH